ncbi:MAG: hypothetical protein GY796_05040 [Chloroflexi bacterium]|nr:hypothetical protein [Chloroflexota bacterium]
MKIERRKPQVKRDKMLLELPFTDAWEAVKFCEYALWKEEAQPVREYLYQRGLNDETIRHFRLGYCAPRGNKGWGRKIGNLWIPCGIVIPGIADEKVWYLKVRLVPGTPFQCANSKCRCALREPGKCPYCGHIAGNRYRGVTGNRTALFGADGLRGASLVLLTEGEFDCMLAWQEVRDVIAPVTFGANSHTNMNSWLAYLRPTGAILTVFDEDGKSDRPFAQLQAQLPHVYRTRLPVLRPGDKDLTDFYLAGGDLWKDWLKFQITRLNLATKPTDLLNYALSLPGAVLSQKDGIPLGDAYRCTNCPHRGYGVAEVLNESVIWCNSPCPRHKNALFEETMIALGKSVLFPDDLAKKDDGRIR